MAQYSYLFACGHGHGVVRLYGKERDRQYKLAWYEQNFACPECYKKQKAEEDAKAEKTAGIHLAVYDKVYLSIEVDGQLAVNKSALYELGYRWEDDLGDGLLALLHKPKRVLQKYAAPQDMVEVLAVARKWKAELDALGYKITQTPTVFDQSAARMWFEYRDKQAAEQRKQKEAAEKAASEKQERIRKLDPKPTAPAWYREIRAAKKYWNHKFYGNAKQGWRIYVDDQERKISSLEKEAFEKWEIELKEWKEFWQD